MKWAPAWPGDENRCLSLLTALLGSASVDLVLLGEGLEVIPFFGGVSLNKKSADGVSATRAFFVCALVRQHPLAEQLQGELRLLVGLGQDGRTRPCWCPFHGLMWLRLVVPTGTTRWCLR